MPGHSPTQQFTLAEIQAMTDCSGPEWVGKFAPEGWSIWKDHRGRLIVGFIDSANVLSSYVVRPIIRVPAPSRRVQ